MQLCWKEDPRERPTFARIVSNVEELLPRYVNASGRKSVPQTPASKRNGNCVATTPAKTTASSDTEDPYAMPPDAFSDESLLASFISHLQSHGMTLEETAEEVDDYTEMGPSKTTPSVESDVNLQAQTSLTDHVTPAPDHVTVPRVRTDHEKLDSLDYSPVQASASTDFQSTRL